MKPLIALALFLGAIASAQTPVVTNTSGTPVVGSGTPIVSGATGTPIASGGTPVIGGGSTPVVVSGGYIQWSTPPAFQTMTAGLTYWIGTPGAFVATTAPLMANSAVTTGQLQGLFTISSAFVAAGNTVTVTVYDGATPTALTCTLAAGTQKCSDFTDKTPVTQGDKIYVAYQCAGTCGTNSLGTTIAIVGIEPVTTQQLPGPLMRRKNATIAGEEKHR